ncbi:unnamed protein product [Caenorhabditis brenneri]
MNPRGPDPPAELWFIQREYDNLRQVYHNLLRASAIQKEEDELKIQELEVQLEIMVEEKEASQRELENMRNENAELKLVVETLNEDKAIATEAWILLRKEKAKVETKLKNKDQEVEGLREKLRKKEDMSQDKIKRKDKEADEKKRDLKRFDDLISRKIKISRVKTACDELEKLSGGNSQKFYPALMKELGKRKLLRWKLTSKEGFLVYHLANLTRRKYRMIKTQLKKHGSLDVFPSEIEVVKMERAVVTDDMMVVKEHDKEGGEKVVSVELKNVSEMITARVQELQDTGKLILDDPSREFLWLTVLGDKGSQEFKLALSIGNVSKPNSCHHLIPLGIFDDDESSINILKYLGDTVDQLNRLDEVKITIDGKEKVIPVEQFLGGDMKYQYGCLGHQGGASAFNCMLCYTSKGQLIGIYKRGVNIRLRSHDSYASDSLKDTPYTRRNVLPCSRFLFPLIKLNRVIPASLHILMGLSQRYGFDVLILWSAQMDNPKTTLQKQDIKKSRISKGKILEIDEKLETLLLFTKSVSKISKVLLNFKTKQIDESDKETCDAKICLFRDKLMSTASAYDERTMRCGCKRVVHAICCGCWAKEDWDLTGKSDPIRCFQCARKSIDSITDIATKLLDSLKQENDDLNEEKRVEQEKFDRLMQTARGQNNTRLSLEKIWKGLGADMSAWQQNFTGNHVLKLLDENAV